MMAHEPNLIHTFKNVCANINIPKELTNKRKGSHTLCLLHKHLCLSIITAVFHLYL